MDEDDLGCLGCGQTPAPLDRFEMRWCANCDHRKLLLAWGAAHGWPALQRVIPADEEYQGESPAQWTVAIAEGEFFWFQVAAFGKDEFVYALLAALDVFEKEQSA